MEQGEGVSPALLFKALSEILQRQGLSDGDVQEAAGVAMGLSKASLLPSSNAPGNPALAERQRILLEWYEEQVLPSLLLRIGEVLETAP